MKRKSLLNFLSKTGYKRNSPHVRRPMNLIPSGKITMKGVDFPVKGIDNLGNEQMMYPGLDYNFPGDYVLELPMMQPGGSTSNIKRVGKRKDEKNYIDSVLNANKNLDWVQRLYEKNPQSIQIPGVRGRATHYMESADNRVYPTVVRLPNSNLEYLGNDAYNYADSTKSFIQFPSDEEAQWFAKNYKKGTAVLPKKQKAGEWMGNKLDKQGLITYETKGGNYIAGLGNSIDGDQYINRMIDSGKFGYNPNNGALVRLGKPSSGMSKESAFYASPIYKELTSPVGKRKGEEGFLNRNQEQLFDSLPKWQQDIVEEHNAPLRNAWVKKSNKEMYESPLTYVPGMIGFSMLPLGFSSAYGLASSLSSAAQGNYKTAALEAGLSALPFASRAYRLNPNALKQPNLILTRTQKPGQTADLARLDELLQKQNLTIAEKKELSRLNQPGYGRGFDSDPNSINYYANPNIQQKRGYSGMPEIRVTSLPAEEAAKFNVGKNPVKDYISFKKDKEFLLPRNYVEASESFMPKTYEELDQLRRAIDAEQTALSTPHWWRGYPSTPKQLPGFRSEIDWGKWNPDTPKYPELINEYNAIEESTKKAGTWMKNADGSPFKGTAEQFIQQQSSYFKKAFPNPVRERRPDFFSDEVLGGQDPKKYFDENMPIQYNYHSSPNEFDFFDENLFSTGGFGKGIYTTRLPQNMYGKNQYQLYLNANNPQPYSYTRFVTKNGSEVAERVNAPKLVHEKTFYQQLEPGRDYFNPAEESSQSVVPFSNYPKSAKGNVGFFDMTNPNIYKAAAPISIGLGTSAAQEYQKGGQHGGLDRWFAEKWVDIKTGKECGRQEGEKRAGYPACRPSKRVSEDTPKTASELSSAEKEKFKRSKTSSERISYQHRRKEFGGEWLEKYDDGGLTYSVKKGDTLSKIAAQNNTTVNKIVQANNIKNPNFIQINQKLVIPQSIASKSQEGPKEFVDWREKKKQIDDLNALPDEALITGFYRDKPDDTYLVVDKKNAQMKVYKGDKLVTAYEVGVGANPGDAQTVTKLINGKVDWNAGNKSTGAGVYTISNIDPASKSYYGLPSFNLKNDRGIEVATTIHGTPVGRRSRFDNDNVEDNRMSYGCINGKCLDLKDLQKHVDVNTPVYILPEDKGNRFEIVDGKPVLRVSSENRNKYNTYTDNRGNLQKGQGANQSVNTLSYKPIQAVFDENKFKEKVFTWKDLNDEKELESTTKPFYNALVKHKQAVMKIAKIPSDVYNELAQMAFGIYGTESNFGDTHSAIGNFGRAIAKKLDSKGSSSPDYKAKATTYGADEEYRSVGLTQMRWSYLNDDEKKVLNSLGIKSNMDFLNPEKAAIGTVALLAVRYNQQLGPEQKKDIWKHLPTKWNKRSNYADRVKQNSQFLTFKEQTNKRQTGGQTNNERKMVEGIADILTMVKDPANRKSIAKEMVRDFKREDVNYNLQNFLKMANVPLQGMQQGGQRTSAQILEELGQRAYMQPSPALDNVRVIPQQIMSVQEAKKLKAERDARELARRKAAIEASQKAASKPYFSKERWTAENFAAETGATGDKLRFFPNDPDSFVDEYLNPFKMVGDMASSLGRAPLNISKGNYGQAAMSVVTPVVVGATAGIGAKSAGQFVNNLANPLAGTGQFLTTKTPLKNAYKYNPWAFKSNPEAYYRMIGDEGYVDAMQSGVIRANQKIPLADNGEPFGGMTTPEFDVPYFSKGRPWDESYKGPYMIEAKNVPMQGRSAYPETAYVPENTIMSTDPNLNFYKQDWLRGYKEVPKPKTLPGSANSKFQSEIDWSKWNLDTPKYPELINEYNAIEESTKKAGTWMKNPDGSLFQGTPEQFIQQQSSWFKKAFPEGYNEVWRGANNNPMIDKNNMTVFTADKILGNKYAGKHLDRFYNPNIENPVITGRNLFNLVHRKSPNSFELNFTKDSWLNLPLETKENLLDSYLKDFKQYTEELKVLKKQSPETYSLIKKSARNNINRSRLKLHGLRNLIENDITLLETLKKKLGDNTTTDAIAKYLEDNNIDYAKLNNINDGGLGDVTIVNHKPGNYLKSAIGNVGFYDMANPNIYKKYGGLSKAQNGEYLYPQNPLYPKNPYGFTPGHLNTDGTPIYSGVNDPVYFEKLQNNTEYTQEEEATEETLADIKAIQKILHDNKEYGYNYADRNSYVTQEMLEKLIKDIGDKTLYTKRVFGRYKNQDGTYNLDKILKALNLTSNEPSTPLYLSGLSDVSHSKNGGELFNGYKRYIMGDYKPEEEKDLKNTYDKLNRNYYKKAKESGMTAPNYIMSML